MMTVRVVVMEKEPILKALRRLKKLIFLQGVTWEMRRRNYFIDSTNLRRAKQFKKRFKSRKATFLAKKAGEQPVSSVTEATAEFWKRTGKP
jgi:ribosomal protein S21